MADRHLAAAYGAAGRASGEAVLEHGRDGARLRPANDAFLLSRIARAATEAALTTYLDSLLGELPEESDCGVCGLPGEYHITVCEGYSVPRCHAHRLTIPYQAESRLASLRDSLASGPGSGGTL